MTLEEYLNTKAYNEGKPLTSALGTIQFLFSAMFVTGFGFWIWNGWDLGWRIILTGLLGMTVIGFIYSIIKKELKKQIRENLKPQKMTPEEIKQCKTPEGAWEYYKSKAFVGECPQDIDELVKKGFEESLTESEKYTRLMYVVAMVQAKADGKLK